ncbi:cytoplasmic protein [Klebsiella sp. RHBSTW-00484]|uniref:cytoplasmic protein n=1 Tax=unclassified Klebsiella TaxID=2608929 RepID=UPI0015E4FDBF|nr:MULTISPECIES: cytoplasmic protein [unclassified Klebsiella]MBA7847794.1 cytoplasmic protein [Klebsiella sp. RHBSTW-00465]QLO39808.1 cytoplasmic protein [Klebsiella sp. RHBSTW-00484]QLT79327.1 cytoplasmic protein [Klebsiella sp. RHBSTW-00464]
MLTLFTINTCKSFGCRNLGLPISASADYSWPDYRLGYPALHCRACGSYPPLFDEQQFNEWLSVHLTAYASERGLFCPVCYGKETICYGHNPQGTQRIQCRACKKVWTPKQQLHREIAQPERIESVPLIVPFLGRSAEQKLYVLLSFDAVRGNILHLSTNFTQHHIGETLRYHWRGNMEPDLHHSDIVKRVDMRETQFLRRSQFDEIQYGSAVLKRNARGAIVRPVIAAHGHFRVLNLLFPKVKTHVISHECFLRGAVITVWADLFRQQQGELWFIEEDINDSDINIPWNFQGITQHGWWQSQWQLWGQGKNRKMVCPLTGGDSSNAKMLSLTASRHFIHWLYKQTAFTHSTQLSAGRITQILLSLAQDYNCKLTAASGELYPAEFPLL